MDQRISKQSARPQKTGNFFAYSVAEMQTSISNSRYIINSPLGDISTTAARAETSPTDGVDCCRPVRSQFRLLHDEIARDGGYYFV